MTAKAHGLTDECQAILEASGLTEDQIRIPETGAPLSTPKAIVPTHESNWPLRATSQSFFEKALLGQVEALTIEEPAPTASNHLDFDDEAKEEASRSNGNLMVDDEDEAGWDIGEDIVLEEQEGLISVDNDDTAAGTSEAELWARNSPIAADHVAAGSFDSAMQLLNRQVGAVDFEPLKPRFMEIYQATRTYLPASAGLPPLVNYVRRTLEATDSRKVLPIIPRDLEYITTNDLQAAFATMKNNVLDEGVVLFRRILHTLLLSTVKSKNEVEEVSLDVYRLIVSITDSKQAKKIIQTATEYILAMTIELERRSIEKDAVQVKRNLELSAYFTKPQMELPHRQIALMAAMKVAYTKKNFLSAANFASRVLANNSSGKNAETVSSIAFRCASSVADEILS